MVLLERGPWLETFGHMETRDAWVTGIDRRAFRSGPDEVRTVRASDRDTARSRGAAQRAPCNAAGDGGRRLGYYGAMAWRFHPETFRLRSLLGSVPEANLADWPVTYEDLEPYYEKAEYELGVSGDENPYGPPRQKPLPLPPVPENSEAAVLFPAARRLGWKPFHTPLAILSRDPTADAPPACAALLQRLWLRGGGEIVHAGHRHSRSHQDRPLPGDRECVRSRDHGE